MADCECSVAIELYTELLSKLYKIPPTELSETIPNYFFEKYYSRHCKASIFKVYFEVGGSTESPDLITDLHKNKNAVLEFHINIELAFKSSFKLLYSNIEMGINHL